jgi:hypothetical protein
MARTPSALRSRRFGGAVGVVLLASACGTGWSGQAINDVQFVDGGRVLVVGTHCNPDASLEVSESLEAVSLKLRVKGSSEGDCARSERVELDAPLGNRAVIDLSTGEAVAVHA